MTDSRHPPPVSVGTATLLPDGAIQLDLHASEGGRRAQTRVVYPPNHPAYADVLRHLGDLKPGEPKPVPPWD